MSNFMREHYTHFLLAHAKDLKKYAKENGSDYFEETKMLEDMFELVGGDYIESAADEIFNTPLSDVISDKWFLNKAIELYEEATIPEIKLYVQSSFSEEVIIRARSVEEAIEKFHKDEAKYSKVAKQFGDSDDFNGIGAMTSGDGTL